jgi:hypothetical protein
VQKQLLVVAAGLMQLAARQTQLQAQAARVVPENHLQFLDHR